MSISILLDGRDIREFGMYVLEDHEHPLLPDTRDKFITIPDVHGVRDMGSTLGPRYFYIPIGTIPQKNYEKIRRLTENFISLFIDQYGKPKYVKLTFSYYPERYYKVRYAGQLPLQQLVNMGVFTLPLIATDPFAYAPATYYDPDVVGNYADSVYGFEIVGKHDANNKPIENPTLLGQIGGRNLLRNSKGPFILEPKNTGKAEDNYNYYRFYCDMELNETYTISADIEITHGDFDKVDVYPYPGGKTSAIPIPSNGRIKHTFVKTSETINSVLIYAGLSGSTRGQGIIIRNVKIEKGNKATDWTPAPEDEGWPMKLVIEDKFYGDGTKNDRLIFEDGELYKEQWWEIINGVPILKDKPEKKLAKQKGGIYIAEGINTIHLTDDSGLLDSAIIRYQKGTFPITKGDNIVDIPKLDFNTYGVDLEYKNQVYSPFKNKRQYVGVYNYSQYETPFSFVIQGYCRNPKITNQTTGKSLKFNDLTLGANERLYVDSRRMTAWKIKIADDKYEFLTPHKIMRDYDAWDKINAHPNKSGDFLMLTAGNNSILFESDDTPDAEIYLDWEHRFL